MIWGIFPLCWGLGVFPISWGFGVISTWGVHMLLLVHSCSSIMSHVSPTAMTTTPVMVVSSGLSSVSSVTVAPSVMGLSATLGQCEVVQPPALMPRGSGGVIDLASVLQQQPTSSMPLLAYANYAMGFLQVDFFFRVEPPTILYILCLVSVLVSALYFQVPSWMLYSPMGAQLLGFAPLQPFRVYPWQAYVQPGDGHEFTTGMHRVAAPSATLSRGEPSATQLAFPQPSYLYGGAYSLGGSAESHPIPPPSLHDGEGSSFPGLVPSDDTVNSESVMGIKPGYCSVVIGYQVDEFTHTCSAEQFVACTHIILGSLVRCHH